MPPNPFSKTETFIRLPLLFRVNVGRCSFLIITGKSWLKNLYIEIIFHSTTTNENRLIIEIQPEEKIDLVIQAKFRHGFIFLFRPSQF